MPAWGEVTATDADGQTNARLLPSTPPEHDPNYYSALFDAFQRGGNGANVTIEAPMILPPVGRPPIVLAIGLNYQDHLDESNAGAVASGRQPAPQPFEPTLFVKFPSSVIGHEDSIVLPHMASSKVDYEAELAVVIGRQAKNVSADRALEHVAFYTCAHDVSARDAQIEAPNGQWVRGKSFDTFCPLGPYAATGIHPSGLDIRLILNGNVMQSSNTRNLIFKVESLISYLSHSITLLPGTVILTGTPGGVGHFMEPPVYLQPGDVAEVEIEGIGTLRNSVVADDYIGSIPPTKFAR